MADADEDLIPALDPARHSRQLNTTGEDGGASEDESDSDVAPDYRFLSSTTAGKHALPSRGVKDFEPNPTARQASTLDLSRKAMTDALSVVRVHTLTKKRENIAVYLADPAEWDGQRYEHEFLSRVDDLEKRRKMNESSALQAGEGRCVVVERFSSTYSRTVGRNDRRNWTWLLPEEALFLLERGSLDIRYHSDADPDSSVEGNDGQSNIEDSEGQQLSIGKVPMSLQGAYAAFIGKGGLTLERYQVYANLRRNGYVVQRAPTWHGPVESTDLQLQTQAMVADAEDFVKLHTTPRGSETGLIYRLFAWLFDPTLKPSTTRCYNPVVGPLIRPGLFRNYADVYRQLYLIPQHNTKAPHRPPTTQFCSSPEVQIELVSSEVGSDLPLLPTWHVNKPGCIAGYKKSAPPPADYTVVVLDARSTTIPTSEQIGNLLASMPDDELKDGHKKRLETRIKHGKRGVMLGVVDNGIISYLRFSGGGFGPGDWLWEENERRGRQTGGGKGRGGRGGRGRGRGRGGRAR